MACVAAVVARLAAGREGGSLVAARHETARVMAEEEEEELQIQSPSPTPTPHLCSCGARDRQRHQSLMAPAARKGVVYGDGPARR